MKISVLINNYNYARFLPEALASVVAQSHPAHEIIVVDDGSTDDSIQVLERLRAATPRLRIHCQSNRGQLAAFRAGIQLATGHWCAFLDADDTWTREHLAMACKPLLAHPRLGFYYSGHQTSTGREVYKSKWPAGKVGSLAHLVAGTGTRVGTITSTLLMARDLASAVTDLPEAYDAQWRTRADDCLLFGASLSGAESWYSPAQTVVYRLHERNAFARAPINAADEAAYNQRRTELLTCYRSRFSIGEKSTIADILDEWRIPANARHAVVRRRYRRLLGRFPAPWYRRVGWWFAMLTGFTPR